jgi:histidine ammonia-lyase
MRVSRGSTVDKDRILHYDIENTVSFLNTFQIENNLLTMA